MGQAAPVNPVNLKAQDFPQLLEASKKDNLPQLKLSQYNGYSLQWHEWFGQSKSAIDSATLSDDVEPTFLKTLNARYLHSKRRH